MQSSLYSSARSLKRLFRSILLFFMAAILVSCTTGVPKPSSSIEPSVTPVTQTIRLAVLPVIKSDQQNQKLKALQDYLQKVSNQAVEIQLTKDYDAAVELLVHEKVEMAYLGPLTYIKAREQNPNLDPVVIPIEQASGRPWYTSVIVVRKDRNINSLSDLKGKRFAFVSPSSTSGFLLPMHAFQQSGIDPSRDFAQIRYSKSHEQAILDLSQGVVDAVPIENSLFSQAQRDGKLSPTEYKRIWESDPIPNTPIVVNRRKLSEEVVSRLTQALINAPAGIADVSGINSDGYTLTKDADFEQIRQIYQRLKSVTVAEK